MSTCRMTRRPPRHRQARQPSAPAAVAAIVDPQAHDQPERLTHDATAQASTRPAPRSRKAIGNSTILPPARTIRWVISIWNP